MLFGPLGVLPVFQAPKEAQMGPEDAQKLNKWAQDIPHKWARSIRPTETFLTNGLGP